MKKFMDEDFVLTTNISKKLYHGYAEKCPVIDCHTQLSAEDIFEQRRSDNLTRLWLEPDEEKLTAMRRSGIDEFYITGVAADYDKFLKFAEVLPGMIGSQLYVCAHLELQRYFGIHTPLNKRTAPEIWHKAGEKLAKKGYDTVSLLDKMGVKVLCTADDPADDLEWHLRCAHSDKIPFRVLPSFRPDRFMNIDNPEWFTAITQLGARYGSVHDWDSLKEALSRSLDFFCDAGCRVADHGLIKFSYAPGDPVPIVEKMIHHGSVTKEETAVYQGALQKFLDEEYGKRGLMKLREASDVNVEAALQRATAIRTAKDIDLLMETGMLSGSVGMLTDSRSFTSFVRHEYYRRILCDKIGHLVETGQYPADIEFLGEMIRDICWKNAVEYFGFEL